MINASNKYWSKPGSKERMSKACIKKFEDEEEGLKISRTLKQLHKDNPGLLAGKNNPMFGMYGELSGNWQGGKSFEEYCEIWLDKDYKYSIKERDGFKCQNPDCLGKSKYLVVHHINYNKKDCNPKNLIILCRSCHAKSNFNRNYWESFYVNIIEANNIIGGVTP